MLKEMVLTERTCMTQPGRLSGCCKSITDTPACSFTPTTQIWGCYRQEIWYPAYLHSFTGGYGPHHRIRWHITYRKKFIDFSFSLSLCVSLCVCVSVSLSPR